MFTAMPKYDMDIRSPQIKTAFVDMLEHGLARDGVHNFWQGAFHACTLAGREDDDT
jgi:hypothetical protein